MIPLRVDCAAHNNRVYLRVDEGECLLWGMNSDVEQSPAVMRPGTRPVTRWRRRLFTNETAATGGVMYTDEGELEFDEDEMSALEGQRLVAEFRC